MRKISLIFAAISMLMQVACTKNSDMQWEFIEFDLTGVQATVNKGTHSYQISVPKEGADYVFRPKKERMGYSLNSCWQYDDSQNLLKTGSEKEVSGDWFQAYIEYNTEDQNQNIILQTTLHVHIDPLGEDKNLDENGNRKMKIGLMGGYVWADLLFVQ